MVPLFVFTLQKRGLPQAIRMEGDELHTALVKAIAAGPEAAREAMQEHIRASLKTYVSQTFGSGI